MAVFMLSIVYVLCQDCRAGFPLGSLKCHQEGLQGVGGWVGGGLACLVYHPVGVVEMGIWPESQKLQVKQATIIQKSIAGNSTLDRMETPFDREALSELDHKSIQPTYQSINAVCTDARYTPFIYPFL